MNYNPDIHHRQSIRLKGYDYRQAGAYFITICVHQRECLWGEIHGGHLHLNAAGKMVQHVWEQIPQRFPHTALDAFVVMPNHFHAIIWFVTPSATAVMGAPSDGQAQGLPLRGTGEGLGEIVGAFKSITTVDYIQGVRRLA